MVFIRFFVILVRCLLKGGVHARVVFILKNRNMF